MVSSITLSSFLCACWKVSDHQGSGVTAPVPCCHSNSWREHCQPGLQVGLQPGLQAAQQGTSWVTPSIPWKRWWLQPWSSCSLRNTLILLKLLSGLPAALSTEQKEDQSPNWVRVMTEFLLSPRLTKQTHQNKIKTLTITLSLDHLLTS